MNLEKKKNLAAKTLKVGKNRIIFIESRLDEIKEAITKQDIKDLYKEGAITIKGIVGRKRIAKKKKKIGAGNVRKKVNKRKQEYIKITRKLRKYASGLKEQGKLSVEDVVEIRKRVRNRYFRSLSSLKEYIKGVGVR